VTIDKIDASTELAVVSDRVGAYLTAHPDTTAYFDMGYFHVAVAARQGTPGRV
jgi:simple sugar transport system substrate-binding protein